MHITEFLKSQQIGRFFKLEGDDVYYRDMAEKHFENLVPDDLKDFNFKRIDELRSVTDLANTVIQSPFVGDVTVVLVCDRAATLKGQEEALLQTLQQSAEECIIVFSCVRFLTKKLDEQMVSISVDRLQGAELVDEIKKMFPGGIEQAAIRLLQEYTNRDMLRISNEAIKLNAVSGGTMVRAAMVEDVVVSDAETRIFEFQNCLQRKDKEKAFEVMERLIRQGSEPQYLLSAVLSQYRRLLYAAISPLSNAELAKALNIKEYAVQKSREAAKLYKPVRLKQIFDTLTAVEFDIRQGKYNADTALLRVVRYLMEG